MVGDPPLREIVGADAFRAVAGADLDLARGRPLAVDLLAFGLVEARAQHLHRLGAVLVLRRELAVTTMPVGMWVMRTAESVVLTCWPPAPEARIVSMRMSSGRMSMSTSSASGSTATVAAEVWMRPLASVAGTRCTRCTPDSNLSRAKTPLPERWR